MSVDNRWRFLGRLVAEFVVVIVGILIALQLEETRRLRDSARLETAQLLALRSDLLENRLRLDSVVVWQDSTVLSGRILVAIHAGQTEPPPAAMLASFIGWATSWWRFEPVTGAYDSMVSSGDITRLQDQELSRDLASFSGDLRVGFEDQEESMALLMELRRMLAPYGLDVSDPVLLEQLGVSGNPSLTALSSVVSDSEFVSFVAIRTRMEMNRGELYERVGAAIDRMLATIEAELRVSGAL